ncbi:MAG: hypothetical protein JXR41_12140 [Bacteroidales bacterium]|nr:hypothetical protein [Bacteroidales bacterium]MBN2763835.1 hypothetical protein [Bacteroidales bacterium]
MKEIIKPAIELLAGFPSVVIGFFVLMVLVSFFQQFYGYASLGLGASKLQTAFSVILPAATPDIFAAVILCG